MAILFRCVSLILMALVASCGGGGQDGAGSAAAIATPQMARAVAPSCRYDHVYVTVEKILINQGAGQTEVVLPSPRRIDLVGLSNGVLEALGTAPLPAGHYTAVRLVLTSNSTSASASMANAVQPTGGSLTPLSTPSAQQSGLKLQADFDVAAGQRADLILDPDACASVVKAGNSGKYVLNPVLSVQPRIVTVVENEERMVNTATAGDQQDPAITALKDGGYVVVWTSSVQVGPDLVDRNIYAQKYDASGAKVGGETLVYDGAPGPGPGLLWAGMFPGGATLGVTPLEDGGFVVTWMGPGPSSSTSILSQRLDASAHLVGGPTQVNTTPFSEPFIGSTAVTTALADGGYLVTWERVSTHGVPQMVGELYTQRFDVNGSKVGGEVMVGGVMTPAGFATTALHDGGWLVAWSSFANFHDGHAVYTQQFTSSGATASPVMRLHQTMGGGLAMPGAATLANGNYVVVWRGDSESGSALSAQLFDPAGIQIGGQIDVATFPGIPGRLTFPYFPKVTALKDGGFLVSWQQSTRGSWTPPYNYNTEILAQYFDAAGHAAGGTIQLQPTQATPVVQWSVIAMPDDGFVVATEKQSPSTGWDVYVKKFDASWTVLTGTAAPTAKP